MHEAKLWLYLIAELILARKERAVDCVLFIAFILIATRPLTHRRLVLCERKDNGGQETRRVHAICRISTIKFLSSQVERDQQTRQATGSVR